VELRALVGIVNGSLSILKNACFSVDCLNSCDCAKSHGLQSQEFSGHKANLTIRNMTFLYHVPSVHPKVGEA
jgi:hypothetical protein